MNSEDAVLTPSPVRCSICGGNIPEKKEKPAYHWVYLCTRKQLSRRSQLLMNQSINYYLQENYAFSERRLLKQFSLRET
jgi:hypothetical protein